MNINGTTLKYLSIIILLLLGSMFVTESAYAAADTDFVSKLVKSFNDQATRWEPILRKHALNIFRWLLIFEVAYLGISVSLGREQIADTLKQFIILLLMSGFFLAVINNYNEWSWNIIHGLQGIAGELGTHAAKTQAPFKVGMDIVKIILDKLSGWSPGNSVALLFAALIVIICFSFISARMVLIKCEAIIAMAAALLLVGFGSSRILKDYAVNALRYVLSVGFKLFVMQLVIGIGITFIEEFSTSTAKLEDIFVVIGASIVLLALVQTIPDIVAGIINGSQVGGGTGLGAAATAVGGAAIGAGIAAGGVTAAGSAVGSASKLADLQGKTGLGKLASMAGSLFSAYQDSKTPQEKTLATRTSDSMRERLDQTQLNQE